MVSVWTLHKRTACVSLWLFSREPCSASADSGQRWLMSSVGRVWMMNVDVPSPSVNLSTLLFFCILFWPISAPANGTWHGEPWLECREGLAGTDVGWQEGTGVTGRSTLTHTCTSVFYYHMYCTSQHRTILNRKTLVTWQARVHRK